MSSLSLFRMLSAFSVVAISSSFGQISVDGSGAYSTNFDGLISTGTQSLSSTTGVPTALNTADGWFGTRGGGSSTNAINFIANDGSINTGALYSYGATGSSDRALGSLASGSNFPAFGAWFSNDSGSLFTSITISFTAEFWRSSTVNQNVLSFAYGFDTTGVSSANFLTSTSMTAVSNLNVVGPAPVLDPPSNGALDGNNPNNQQYVTFTIEGINWYSGTDLFIRWTDVNETGNDAGLAIDGFSLQATGGGGSSGQNWQAGTWVSTAGTGGSGTWGDGYGGWDPAQQGIFGGTGGTVTISNTATAEAGIVFSTDGYVVTGGELVLESTPEITVFPDATTRIESVVSGNSGLTKLGSGILHLAGTNTFTGGVAIDGGLIEIDSDASLGDAGNAIVLGGGGIRTTADLELNGLRTVSGTGTLDVAIGTTLRIAGDLTAALTLTNSGTVTIGAASTLEGLTFEQSGVLTTDIGVFLTGNVAATHTAGTARMEGYYDLGAGTRIFNVVNGSADVDLEVAATLAGSSYLYKQGEGTLYLSGDTTSEYSGGLRIGVAGGASGGRVVLGVGGGVGASTLQMNHGTLEAESELVTAVGVSIGGREGRAAVLSGADMTFAGESSLYEGTNQQSRLDVHNVTTFNGTFIQNEGTVFVGTGFTVGGTGTLILNGDGSGQTRVTTVTDTATLTVNNIYGAAVTVNSGATLKGTGTIAGMITVSGVHAVGNSAGIQTASGGASYLSGSAFEWELVANANAVAGTEFDQLVVTAGNIDIASGAEIELVFNSLGSVVDWSDSFWSTDHSWTVIDNTGTGSLVGVFGLNASGEWIDSENQVLADAIAGAYFDVSYVDGDVILNYYAIPEPGTVGLTGVAGLIFALRRRTRGSGR